MTGVNEGTAESSPRLSDVLFNHSQRPFTQLAVLGSNYEAIESAKQFVAGVEQFLAIVGPSGWGKSTLLTDICDHLSGRFDAPIQRMDAMEYLRVADRLDPNLPVVLDDVQVFLKLNKGRQELYRILERRVRAGRFTAMALTISKGNRELTSFLPNHRHWRISTIGRAKQLELVSLIQRVCEQEGLVLADELVDIIAQRMLSDGRTISGALKRLRLSGGSWLTARSQLQALGILDPYFADNPHWDLRMQIASVGGSLLQSPAGLDRFNLAIYCMLHEAGLSEASVAHSLGLAPLEVYLRANAVTEVRHQPMIDRAIQDFALLVVDSLKRN